MHSSVDSQLSSQLLRYLLLPLLILALGMLGFIFVTATKAHHRNCERSCALKGERYGWDFAFAPVYAPACVCHAKR